MKKPLIISVVNHKGGVGKTTTTINLAAGLARLKKTVLVVDLDTQMNLTHSLIDDLREDEFSISEAILDPKNVPIKSIIRKTHILDLDIAPASESMVDLELRLHSVMGRESVLKMILRSEHLSSYDYIFLDNHPHLGLTTVNSLVASHCYLVPVSAEYLPLVGIKNLIRTIDSIKPINPKIRNLGYLLTMVDRREGIAGDVETILRKSFKEEVFENVVRINTKLKACPQKKKTIFEVEPPKGKGFSDFIEISSELLKRVEALK
jgi:chromosome partitioning protein